MDSDFAFDIFTGEQHPINKIWGFFRTFCQATDCGTGRKVELIATAFAAMDLTLYSSKSNLPTRQIMCREIHNSARTPKMAIRKMLGIKAKGPSSWLLKMKILTDALESAKKHI